MISSYFSVAVLFNHGSTFSNHSHLMNMDMTSPLSPRRLAEEEKGYNIRDKDYEMIQLTSMMKEQAL